MAKSGSAIKPEIRIGLQLDVTAALKKKRDLSTPNQEYEASLKKANETLSKTLKIAEQDPEGGLAVARQCARFVLEAMPDPGKDDGRAAALSQIETLENMLAIVRKPGQYLATMQNQFGPNLDPRNYKSGDAFNSIIKSQRQKLYTDGQSSCFSSHDEKLFCRKRSELLAAVEKGYNQLRDKAMGRPPDKGLGR